MMMHTPKLRMRVLLAGLPLLAALLAPAAQSAALLHKPGARRAKETTQ